MPERDPFITPLPSEFCVRAKTGLDKAVNVSFTLEEWQWIRREAANKKTSMSALVRGLLAGVLVDALKDAVPDVDG